MTGVTLARLWLAVVTVRLLPFALLGRVSLRSSGVVLISKVAFLPAVLVVRVVRFSELSLDISTRDTRRLCLVDGLSEAVLELLSSADTVAAETDRLLYPFGARNQPSKRSSLTGELSERTLELVRLAVNVEVEVRELLNLFGTSSGLLTNGSSLDAVGN